MGRSSYLVSYSLYWDRVDAMDHLGYLIAEEFVRPDEENLLVAKRFT